MDSNLQNLLRPLHEGVWEVTIPKELVSLASCWKRSPINLPTPGTIASFRHGQYHAHETASEWRIHLDRYDPEEHPIMHLIDDAPLLLMIMDTFMTLIAESRGKNSDITSQNIAWKKEIAGGILLIALGASFVISPEAWFSGITGVLIPLLIVIAGAIFLFTLISDKSVQRRRRETLQGLLLIAGGFMLADLPQQIWSMILTFTLMIWMLASGIVLILQVYQRKGQNREGVALKVLIGSLSLLLAVLLFIEPEGVISLFLLLLGTIIMILGVTLISVSIRLWRRMHRPNQIKTAIPG